jgi:hypothetical protein
MHCVIEQKAVMSLLPPLDPKAALPWEAGLRVEPADATLPGLSVVVPIYNAGRFLERTLRSLLCNDLSGVEIIVMDGGSTDDTARILKHYAAMFAVVRSERDKGQSDAINRGMAMARQPLLCWLNGDDLLMPNVLNTVRAAFRDRSDCNVLVGNAWMSELNLTPIRRFVYSPETLRLDHLLDYARNHLVQPSVFFTRHAWTSAGPVAVEMHYAMDADLFLRMASMFEFQHLDVDLAHSVYHEDCKTRSARAESIAELALVQARHGGMVQAAATLKLLVDLYYDIQKGIDATQPGPANGGLILSLREQALQARVAELERRLLMLAEGFLELDMLETA